MNETFCKLSPSRFIFHDENHTFGKGKFVGMKVFFKGSNEFGIDEVLPSVMLALFKGWIVFRRFFLSSSYYCVNSWKVFETKNRKQNNKVIKKEILTNFLWNEIFSSLVWINLFSCQFLQQSINFRWKLRDTFKHIIDRVSIDGRKILLTKLHVWCLWRKKTLRAFPARLIEEGNHHLAS